MPTKSRMKEHYGCFLQVNNRPLKILSDEKYGVYPYMIERIVEQLDTCIAIHKRVLVVRFDLSLDEYSGDNHIISTFINRQKQRIHRKEPTKLKTLDMLGQESKKHLKHNIIMLLFLLMEMLFRVQQNY